MKLSFINDQLTTYDREKSVFRRMAGDYNEVQQLRQLVTPQGQPDRDLTIEELYKVFAVLLPPDQTGRATDEKVGFLLNRIRSHRGVEFEAAHFLYHLKPSLFNQENFVSLLSQSPDLKKLLVVLNKLPSNLHTLENIKLLQDQSAYLDEMIDLFTPGCRAQLATNLGQENFLKVCLLSMLDERVRALIGNPMDNGLIKELPGYLLTPANIKSFREVYVEDKKRRNQDITAHDIQWAKILRADILKSMGALSGMHLFDSPEMQDIFRGLCKQTEQEFHVLENFSSLPEGLRTAENVVRLASIKYNWSIISTIKSLAAPLQTNENFGRLVASAGNSETDDVFSYVYKTWNELPPELQTQENFTAMHINSDQYGSVIYRSIEFFNSLQQKTQENFTKLFSLKMYNWSARELRRFSRDLFNRLSVADFVNLDFEFLQMASNTWNLLPENLKTDANLNLLVHQDGSKIENVAAVNYLFSVLPEALRTQENFNEMIANASDINQFKDHYKTNLLLSIFPIIGAVIDEPLMMRIIHLSKNLDSDDISLLVKKFIGVDYIFRLVPPNFRSQENFAMIFARGERIEEFMRTDTAQQMTEILITVPRHLFTPGLYNLIIQLTEATNQAALDAGLNRIRVEVGRLLRPVRQPGQEARVEIQGAQSTHTTSVHKSVSESAVKLMERYGDQIDTGDKLDTVIEDLKNWINSVKVIDLGLDDEKMTLKEIKAFREMLSHQLQAAVRCVDALSNPVYAFVDQSSQVSTRQLLALVWIAVKDDSIRISPRQDRNRKMVVGFYDIKRGYNQDASKEGREAADFIICVGGTFNKLMEILWGIHPDVQLRYLTTTLAGYKIPQATRELVQEFIEKLQTETDKTAFVEQINRLNMEGIEAIWEQIKPQLTQLIYEEFGSLYKGDKDQAFLDLIDSGQYVDLSPLDLKKYLKDAKQEETSEKSTSSANGASAAEASPPLVTKEGDSAASSSGFKSMPANASSASSSSVTFFSSASSSPPASWLSQVENRLDDEIIAVQGFDPKLKAALSGLKELAKQLDKGELSLEHIGKLERNISRLIKDVRPHSESESLAQDAYQQCLTTLSTIGNEVAERKQSITDNRAGNDL